MSRSPVTISVRPPASDSTAASDPSRSSASTSGDDETSHPNAENNEGACENCQASASGTSGRSAWYAGNSSTRYGAASAPKHITIARGPKSAAARNKRLTAPSSALTGFPSQPEDRVGQRVERAIEHVRGVDGDQRSGHPTPEPSDPAPVSARRPRARPDPGTSTRYTPATARRTEYRPLPPSSTTPLRCQRSPARTSRVTCRALAGGDTVPLSVCVAWPSARTRA